MRTWSVHRQDSNDDLLVGVAVKMGCVLEKHGPLEYWFFWAGISTHWTPVEIKDPSRRNHKDQLTPAQQKFMQRCSELGARYEVWRTLEDVQDSRSWALCRSGAA